MNLTTWVPAMILLGLVTFAILYAFLAGCEEV